MEINRKWLVRSLVWEFIICLIRARGAAVARLTFIMIRFSQIARTRADESRPQSISPPLASLLFDFDSEFSVIAFQPFIIQLCADIYLRYYEGRIAAVCRGCMH